MPAAFSSHKQLIGRAHLIGEVVDGVVQGREVIALEGITGVGKSAVLAAIVAELHSRRYCPAQLNAVEQASEDLAIATIYAQLKSFPRDPEATVRALQKRFTANLPKALRSIGAAVIADLMKLAAEKAGKTIDVIQKIASGDLPTVPTGEALDQLEASNKRTFLTHFLAALDEAGTRIVVSIDNVDHTDLISFIRFLISAKPASVVILLAHNTERGDNKRWDDVTQDARAKKGLQRTVEPLGLPEIAEWFHRDVGRWAATAELEGILATTGGRPYELEQALGAIRDGMTLVNGDYSGYYVNRRSAMAGDTRIVAELLAIIPYDASVGVELLERAATHAGCSNVGPALDALSQDRLSRVTNSNVALSHALAQDTWRKWLTDRRKDTLIGAWYEACREVEPSLLISPKTIAIIPTIFPRLTRELPPAEVARIGGELLNAGQFEAGLALVDRGWRFESTKREGGEDMSQEALLAARTRLELGRYSEVDEPLLHAEHSKDRGVQIEALLLRMKLALRRNTYTLLWTLGGRLDATTGDPSHQAAGQAILNTAYRDVLDHNGIRRTTDKLVFLRERVAPKQQMLIDRSIARALAKLGELENALAAAERAFDTANKIGNVRDLGNAFLARAEARRYRGEFREALDDYRQAEEYGRGMGNRDSQLWSLLGAAAAEIEDDHADRAVSPLDKIFSLLFEPGYDHPIEWAHARLLQVLAGKDDDVEQVLKAYEPLGISWPRSLLERHQIDGRITGPTPL